MISKILCLGNGDHDADRQAKQIANNYNIEYCSIIDYVVEPTCGCYHSSIYDINKDELFLLAQKFDLVVCLDQPQEAYKSSRDFFDTVKVVHQLTRLTKTQFMNPAHENSVLDYAQKNSAFCIAPFVSMRNDNTQLTPCCYASKSISVHTPAFDYATDAGFSSLRKSMLLGIKTDVCNFCYSIEELGAVSPRIKYTEELSFVTNQTSVAQLTPMLRNVEIKTSNKCNLMCRMCDPSNSNLINAEYTKIKLHENKFSDFTECNVDFFDIGTIDRVYLAGGEPLIDGQLVKLLDKCISLNRYDLEIVVNTNATVIPQSVIDRSSEFTNLKFEISLDGYNEINNYIRWPSKWDKLVKNIERLYQLSNGKIAFNTAVSIYNVSSLFSVFKFTNDCYPLSEHHIAYVTEPSILSPWKFPNKQRSLYELSRVKMLKRYGNCNFASLIDGLAERIDKHAVSNEELIEFFKFNDILDKSRGVLLKDIIPELESCRELITKQT